MMGKALLSISPAGQGQLVKMFITLDTHGIHAYGSCFAYFKHCPATGMQNGDVATGKI